MHDHRPVNPPQPVWVRIPPQGRQTEAMAQRGLLHAWAREPWYGTTVWVGLVAVDGENGERWTAAGNLRERDEG